MCWQSEKSEWICGSFVQSERRLGYYKAKRKINRGKCTISTQSQKKTLHAEYDKAPKWFQMYMLIAEDLMFVFVCALFNSLTTTTLSMLMLPLFACCCV